MSGHGDWMEVTLKVSLQESEREQRSGMKGLQENRIEGKKIACVMNSVYMHQLYKIPQEYEMKLIMLLPSYCVQLLCDLMDGSPPAKNGLPFPSPGDLPDP